jgi:HK97 family phage major capsid protein
LNDNFGGFFSVKHLFEQRNKLMSDLQAIITSCNTEKRDMTTEEKASFDTMTSDVDAIDEQVERQKKVANLNERASLPVNNPVLETSKGNTNLDEHGSFRHYLSTGETRAAFLSVGTNADGGFTAPVDFAKELVKIIIEKSPIRQLATVVETSLKAVPFPRKSAGPTAAWTGEHAASGQTQSTYGNVNVSVASARCYTDITTELLQDSTFNLEQLVLSDLAEEFARLEGQGFITGDGSNKPSGILDVTNNGITPVLTAAVATLTADDMIGALYGLKMDYIANATWVFNRATMAKVRQLKLNSQYIWNPFVGGQPNNIVGGLPGTILDRPYVIAPDMPNQGTTGNLFMAVGDFRNGYRVVVKPAAQSVSVLRDDFTQAVNGSVRFHGYYRVGGAVVNPEAIVILKDK